MAGTITSVSNEAIDELDAIAEAITNGELGGRNDYWNALQKVIDAGVTVSTDNTPTIEAKQ